MSRLPRLLAYAAATYLLFRIAFPHGSEVPPYHAVSILLLLGGAVAACFLCRLLSLGSTAASWGIEALFILLVFLYFGWSLPQKDRRAPLQKLWRGYRPTRSEAGQGIRQLGLKPESPPARWLIELFPKSRAP